MSSWSTQWSGTATDFMPEFLGVEGKPGRMGKVAGEAIWEAVQLIASQDAHASITVVANGWESRQSPGLGRFTLDISVEPVPSEIQQKLAEQQPVDLLHFDSSATV